MGVVFDPGAMAALAAAAQELERSFSTNPGRLRLSERIKRSIPDHLVELVAFNGLDLMSGGALFRTGHNHWVFIVRVVDRAKYHDVLARFLHSLGEAGSAATGAPTSATPTVHCRDTTGYYVCADSAAVLDTVGTGDIIAHEVFARPVNLRGGIEIYVDTSQAPGSDLLEWDRYLRDTGSVHATVRLERGGFTARAHLATSLREATPKEFISVPDVLAKRVPKSNPNGLWRLRVPADVLVPQDTLNRLKPVAARVQLDAQADLLDNITGEIVGYPLSGDSSEYVIEVGFEDGRRLQPAVRALCMLAEQHASTDLPMISISMDGERCVFDLSALMPGLVFDRVVVHTVDDAVVVALRLSEEATPGHPETTAIGAELFSGSWNWAVWDFGMFGGPVELQALARGGGEQVLVDPAVVQWAFAHLTEFGLGVGVRDDGLEVIMYVDTQWANPELVVRSFQAILTRVIAGDADADDALAGLVIASPNSPLERSYRAGPAGVAVAFGLIPSVLFIVVPRLGE